MRGGRLGIENGNLRKVLALKGRPCRWRSTRRGQRRLCWTCLERRSGGRFPVLKLLNQAPGFLVWQRDVHVLRGPWRALEQRRAGLDDLAQSQRRASLLKTCEEGVHRQWDDLLHWHAIHAGDFSRQDCQQFTDGKSVRRIRPSCGLGQTARSG